MKIRSSNDVSCYPYPAPSEVDSNHGNPCSLVGNSLFPNVGNSPARTSSGAGSETLASPEAGIWTTSLHFPCRSGISVQRRVRDRLHAPPTSPRPRRIRARSWDPAADSPPFRGVLGECLSVSGAETPRWHARPPHSRRFSLRPIAAVRNPGLRHRAVRRDASQVLRRPDNGGRLHLRSVRGAQESPRLKSGTVS